MYIFQNALKNLIRNRGRNILIAIIVLVIIATTVVALIINNTATTVINDYKTRFSSEVSLSPDQQKLMEQAQQSSSSTGGQMRISRPVLSADQITSFMQSEYLDHTVVTADTNQVTNDSIKAVDQDAENSSTSTNSGGGGRNFRFNADGNYTLYGDSWSDFVSGTRAIASDDTVSKNYTEIADNECLISQDLADLNNIAVGDTLTFSATVDIEIPSSVDTSSLSDGDIITIDGVDYTVSAMEVPSDFAGSSSSSSSTSSNSSTMFSASRKINYELKVAGIYVDMNDAYANSNMPTMAALNSRNNVYTTYNTVVAGLKAGESGIDVNATFFLKDPADLDAFTADLHTRGLSDVWTVSTDSSSYETIVKPVENLKSITLTFMIIVNVLGAAILILLYSLSIRERKYEVGVLRAMGMKRSRVARGLWYEIIVLTATCLIVGILVGIAVAQPVSNALLSSQAQAVENASTGSASADNASGPGGPSSGQAPSGGGNFSGGGPRSGQSMSISGNGGRIISNNQSTDAKPLSEMTITFSWITILEIIGIALLLSTLAAVISIARITKYEPIKILMERN
ncbi:MAG: ABC transporter permease [Coriobacteriales bacterium]|jgi:putative ABC transport system permease protein|nr:ABC transporter permease [Coriobacteriales bacterium]